MTSADCPFTITFTGEFTTAGGLEGNGWPGLTPGLVGPRPFTSKDRISPAAAGLKAVTSEESLEWVTAGHPAETTISGNSMGITWSTQRIFPPPLKRRFDGSSDMDA